jgi:hypothetical protein
MALYLVQDQLTAQAPVAPVWSCVSGLASETSEISKKFAHIGSRSTVGLCARMPARLGNPEDRL